MDKLGFESRRDKVGIVGRSGHIVIENTSTTADFVWFHPKTCCRRCTASARNVLPRLRAGSALTSGANRIDIFSNWTVRGKPIEYRNRSRTKA